MTSILPGFGLKLVRVGDGGTAANGLCRSIKKQPLIPSMGQELHSCDTTQIDVLQRPLASRAITRARWITGGSPSASTWASILVPRSSRPRKSIRPAAPRPDLTTRDSLSVCRTGYSSFSKVCTSLTCWCHYMHPEPACQVFFAENQNFLGGGWPPPPSTAQPRYSPARSRRLRSMGPKVMASSILAASPGMNGNTHRPRAADTVLSMERQNHAVPKA